MQNITYSDLIQECKKKEFILDVNDFGQCESVSNLFALARQIQTLFFLEPNTYPNHPEMGIGIGNYKFDFLDSVTLTAIKNKAINQIAQYIPNNDVADVIVEAITDAQSNENSIGVMIELLDKMDKKENFILVFSQNSIKTSKTVSKIYI